MNFQIYKILSVIFFPAIFLLIIYRAIKGKEDFSRLNERLGFTKISKPKGNLIWFHSASVGEANSIFPLIEEIEKKYPKLNFLITTGTRSSAKAVAKKIQNSGKIIHQFVPIDSYICVKKFLNYWQPQVGLFVESELWPNLITCAANNGCELILLNARISEESVRKWKNNPNFFKNITNSINLVIAQSEKDKSRFESLNFKTVIKLDNLKFSAKKIANNAEALGKLLLEISGRKTILAASTSEGEEIVLINTYKKLLEVFPDLLMIIAPRHVNRFLDIAAIASSKKLSFSIRSKSEKIVSDVNVYIADTIGEMGVFYRACDIVFIGGTLNDRGGQNPIEPANLDCCIISGSNYKNFEEVYENLISRNGLIAVKNQDELLEKLQQALSNGKLANEFATNARNYVESKQNVVFDYMKELEIHLNHLV
jgi:3-deoxy-D-manno-octulosonic-acid transferase